jgi:hypothetical protein
VRRITPSFKKEHLESTIIDSAYPALLIGHNGDSGVRDLRKPSHNLLSIKESEIINRILQVSSPVTFLRKPLKFEHLVQTVTTLGGCVSK